MSLPIATVNWKYNKATPRGGPFILLGGMLIMLGGLFGYFLFLVPILRVQAAKSWLSVPCTIKESYVKQHDHRKACPTYSVNIEYDYEVNGRTYRCDQYDFMGGSSRELTNKQQIINRYPAGSTATCYYDPYEPGCAVIERNMTFAMYFIVLPGAAFLLGLIGVVWGIIQVCRK